MSRIAPPLAIKPAMYRHFAVLTLVLTACIAMFADGENSEAASNRPDMRNETPRITAQEKSARRGPALRDDRRNKTTWAPDEPLPTVVEADGWGSLSQGTGPAAQFQTAALAAGAFAPAAMPEAMTMEEYIAWVEQQRKEAALRGAGKPSSGEVDSLLAMSRMRSGSGRGD